MLGPTDRKHLEFNGWTVYSNDDHSDEEVTKFTFTAVHAGSGEEHVLDHSPYEWVSKEAFLAYLHLGFPSRKGIAPWRNETITEEREKLNVRMV